jgi:hypothetical protein
MMVVRPKLVSRSPSGLTSAFQLAYYGALFGENVEQVQSLPPFLSLFFTSYFLMLFLITAFFVLRDPVQPKRDGRLYAVDSDTRTIPPNIAEGVCQDSGQRLWSSQNNLARPYRRDAGG